MVPTRGDHDEADKTARLMAHDNTWDSGYRIPMEQPLPLPEIHALGRTILTDDVATTTRFFVDHFGGSVQPASTMVVPAAGCAKVQEVKLPHHQQTIVFVEDSVKANPAPSYVFSNVLAQAGKDMAKVRNPPGCARNANPNLPRTHSHSHSHSRSPTPHPHASPSPLP